MDTDIFSGIVTGVLAHVAGMPENVRHKNIERNILNIVFTKTEKVL
jgi:hypothetical protein